MTPVHVALALRARANGIRVRHLRLRTGVRRRLSDHRADGLTSSVTAHRRGRDARACRSACRGATTRSTRRPRTPPPSTGWRSPPTRILAGLASFTGTRRRFEPKGEAGGVVVVDDYAHNAGKVAAVVETAKALVGDTGRLLVVFQPHLYSRTRDFAAELGAGLAPADVVVAHGRLRRARGPAPRGLRAARGRGCARHPDLTPSVHYLPSWSEVAEVVAGLARPGDLVLTVGAGDVTMIGPRCCGLPGESHDAGSRHSPELSTAACRLPGLASHARGGSRPGVLTQPLRAACGCCSPPAAPPRRHRARGTGSARSGGLARVVQHRPHRHGGRGARRHRPAQQHRCVRSRRCPWGAR